MLFLSNQLSVARGNGGGAEFFLYCPHGSLPAFFPQVGFLNPTKLPFLPQQPKDAVAPLPVGRLPASNRFHTASNIYFS
ncbi:hypothetical protein [Neisseria leonii]|uniref:hypothetical protein n=1 Tax=Neisseria leonii TaxID=2995413 RepID=UPI00237A430C|nr:hypothetical protein [Neisseria sp. 3986]MDD9325640.1 hypothetical protein [Neisseria sp. 3986]